MSEPKPWFRAKTHGYGASLPLSWEGWVVLAIFALAIVGIMTGAQIYLEGWLRPAAKISGVLFCVLVFSFIVKRRTEGGWRWRWGDK